MNPSEALPGWFHYAKVATTLFAIVNPLGVAPLFASLSGAMEPRMRTREAWVAGATVAAVLVLSVLGGRHLLDLFGISLGAFSVAGGVLLFLMGVDMVRARLSELKNRPEETAEAETKESIAVVPLGIPMLAGPGSISTAIIFSTDARDGWDTLFLLGLSVALGVVTALLLRGAVGLQARLGRTGINVLVRVLGILLVALAVEMLARGAAELLPGLR